MDNKLYEKLINDLKEIEEEIDAKKAKLIDLRLLERIIKRLSSFSDNCEECNRHTIELNSYIKKLKEKHGNFDKKDFKDHNLKINSITSHLHKEHELVTEGYYRGIFMLFGISIGLIIGLTLFKNNIALGIPIGMGIGVVIGSFKDADTKKNGLII